MELDKNVCYVEFEIAYQRENYHWLCWLYKMQLNMLIPYFHLYVFLENTFTFIYQNRSF